MFLTRELMEAAKRFSDAVNTLVAGTDPFELRNSFLAIKLEDGSWDDNVYDTMYDAKKHSDPMRCCYFAVGNYLAGLGERDAAIFLQFHRQARNAGMGQKGDDVPFMSIKAREVYSKAMNN